MLRPTTALRPDTVLSTRSKLPLATSYPRSEEGSDFLYCGWRPRPPPLPLPPWMTFQVSNKEETTSNFYFTPQPQLSPASRSVGGFQESHRLTPYTVSPSLRQGTAASRKTGSRLPRWRRRVRIHTQKPGFLRIRDKISRLHQRNVDLMVI